MYLDQTGERTKITDKEKNGVEAGSDTRKRSKERNVFADSFSVLLVSLLPSN